MRRAMRGESTRLRCLSEEGTIADLMLVGQIFRGGAAFVMVLEAPGECSSKGNVECPRMGVILREPGFSRRRCGLDSDREIHRPVCKSTTLCPLETTESSSFVGGKLCDGLSGHETSKPV